MMNVQGAQRAWRRWAAWAAAAIGLLCAAPLWAQSVQRVEDNSPSIRYGSGWYLGDMSRAWSAGSASVASTTGTQASFTFTGTAVTWIGARGPQTGIASVLIDGVAVAQVDTYSVTEEIRVPMYTAVNLSTATHTITVRANGTRNTASSNTLIALDAFDVPGLPVSRLQDADPAASYSQGWFTDTSSRAWSGGSVSIASASGSRVSFQFKGQAVSWVGARGPQTGIARVTLDGTALGQLDTYSPYEQIQAEVFKATGLSNATHTLTIDVTGTHNATSTDSLVVIDGFEVTTWGYQIQEDHPSISYSAGWVPAIRDQPYNQGATAETITVGAKATVTFTGTGIRWVGAACMRCGMAAVTLDGVSQGTVDTYVPTLAPQHTDFVATGLPAGKHTLTIQLVGKNPLSQYYWILVDAIEIIP